MPSESAAFEWSQDEECLQWPLLQKPELCGPEVFAAPAAAEVIAQRLRQDTTDALKHRHLGYRSRTVPFLPGTLLLWKRLPDCSWALGETECLAVRTQVTLTRAAVMEGESVADQASKGHVQQALIINQKWCICYLVQVPESVF